MAEPLPQRALVDQLYAEVQALGAGRRDTSTPVARDRDSVGKL